MSKNLSRKWLSLLLVSVLVFAAGACSGGGGSGGNASAPGSDAGGSDTASDKADSSGDPQKPQGKLEFSVWLSEAKEKEEKMLNNPNDIVTPYVEKKFNVKVKEVSISNSQSFQERLNQWVATNSVPDIVVASKRNADYAVSTGQFAELDQYIAEMPNFNKYWDPKYWPRFLNDGKKYQIPVTGVNLMEDQYKEDPYVVGPSAWALWVREDLLKKAGYSFTPLEEIAKNTTAVGKKPTVDDFKIEPAIDSPEAFYQMLKKIKDLDEKVGGQPVIPLSLPSWAQFHLGSIFDFGHWRIDGGEVDGFLGTPEAKEYYQYLYRLYKDGLIDKDFVIQKNEQLQEKVASGRVAAGMFVPDLVAARELMAQLNPEAKIRFIQWPKKHPDKGFFDIYEGAYFRVLIKKDFKDIKRLTQFLDWTLSDEALDLFTWGPEEAGLWEMKDGKKVFKDKTLEQAVLSGTATEKGPEYYGIYDDRMPGFSSRIAQVTLAGFFSGTYNPFTYMKSYPPRLDIYNVNKALLGTSGMNYDGRGSYGGNDKTNGVSEFFWSKFQGLLVGKLLDAQTPEQFDKAWDTIYKQFLKEGNYEEAKAEMKKWFDENSNP